MAVLKEAVKRQKCLQSLTLYLLMKGIKKCHFTTSHINQCNLSMVNIARKILRKPHLPRQLLLKIQGRLVDHNLLNRDRCNRFRASKVICQQLCFNKSRNQTKEKVCCMRWIKTLNSTQFFQGIPTQANQVLSSSWSIYRRINGKWRTQLETWDRRSQNRNFSQTHLMRSNLLS